MEDLFFAGTLDELKDKGRLLVRGHQRPILLLYQPVISSHDET